jgi:hypothetical protein
MSSGFAALLDELDADRAQELARRLAADLDDHVVVDHRLYAARRLQRDSSPGMVAQASGAPPAEAPTIEALIEALDPEVRAAIDDVDRTLIALSLQQSPWSRLRSATRMAQTLGRLRRALASQGG